MSNLTAEKQAIIAALRAEFTAQMQECVNEMKECFEEKMEEVVTEILDITEDVREEKSMTKAEQLIAEQKRIEREFM